MGAPSAGATRDAYGVALVELGRLHSDVVALDADLAGSTKSAAFGKEFPDRFFNMGIAEANMVGTAAGLANAGKVPYASSFAMFVTGRAWEQIRNTICHSHLNVKLVGSHSGLTVGEDGASHQALEDVALMRAIPRMTVVVPADYRAAYALTMLSYEHHGPLYLRMGRAKSPRVYEDDAEFEIGRANVLKDGADVAIYANGQMLARAMEAAEILEDRHKIRATVVDVHTVKPLDDYTVLATAQQCGCAVVAEEHTIYGGLGGAIAELTSRCWPVPIEFVGTKEFGRSGKAFEVLDHYGLTAETIVKSARRARSRKRLSQAMSGPTAAAVG
jgi:transketolase